MIDLTKAPNGATHYSSNLFYKFDGEDWFVFLYGGWSPTSLCRLTLEHRAVKLEPAQGEWTIYNNDKPLNELNDEQRGLLVNYLFSNGKIQIFNGEVWLDMLSVFNLINREFIYRAKQKSERELFEDALINAIGDDALSIADDLFDAGFKAPKDGE